MEDRAKNRQAKNVLITMMDNSCSRYGEAMHAYHAIDYPTESDTMTMIEATATHLSRAAQLLDVWKMLGFSDLELLVIATQKAEEEGSRS